MNNKHIQLDFNFCRPLDFQKNLNINFSKNFSELEVFNNKDKPDLIYKHLKFLIIELFSCWSESNEQFLSVSMSKRGYKAKSRYNPNMISSVSIDAINYLKDKKLIVFYPGFFDAKRNIRRLTRIRASEKLIDFFKSYEFNDYEILNNKKRENLFLLDTTFKPMEYKDDFNTHEMREILKNYNALMLKTFFDIPCVNERYITRGDRAKIPISNLCVLQSRSFNNDWKNGGDFIGSWWDKLDIVSLNRLSNHMLINDSETSYIDLANLFPLVISKKISESYREFNIEEFKKKGSFINSLDQLNYILIKGLSSKNLSGLYRSFINDKGKLGIDLKITKPFFNSSIQILKENYKTIYKNFYSNTEINWNSFISEVFYQFLKNSGASNIPVIKIRDKLFYQTKFEENVISNVKKSLIKILNSDKFQLVTKKCYSYEFGGKSSIFNSLVRNKLKYSERFKKNKKNFINLMSKNNIPIFQSIQNLKGS